MSLPSLAKLSQPVHEIFHDPFPVDGRAYRKEKKIVPERVLGTFIELTVVQLLYDHWWELAHDMLPQYENVLNGDWEAAGLDMDKEFPIIPMLGEKLNKPRTEWKAYLDLKDERWLGDKLPGWVVSNDINELELDDIIRGEGGLDVEEGGFNELLTATQIENAIVKCQGFVREKVKEENDEENDE